MKVRFYNFSKRKNSTKQPPATGYIEKEVTLKESTSIKTPSILLNATDFSTYNYAYIPTWGKYYFVSDIISVTGSTTQYDLSEDVLATYKSAIGSTVARIAYASTGWDNYTRDPRISVRSLKAFRRQRISLPFISQTGCYVLTVFNSNNDVSNGMGQSYTLDASNMAAIKNWMGSASFMQQAVNYFLGNPMDAILQCQWVPFPVFGDIRGIVYIGEQPSNALTARTFSGTGIATGYVTVPISWPYDDFRNIEPYTTATLYLPGVGDIDINLSDWVHETGIVIEYAYEYTTGDVSYLLIDSNGTLIQTASANLASLCPLGQVQTNAGGALTSIGGAAGGVATAALGAMTDNVAMLTAGAGAALAGAANATLGANKRAVSVKGTTGGRTSSLIGEAVLTMFVMSTEDPTNANYKALKGLPVAKTQAISNHSGYVQCDDASVSIAGNESERDEINGFLNGGFYYE